VTQINEAFRSAIKVGEDKLVDGKSILSLMMLAASKGTVLNLIIEGDDEQAALDAVTALVNNRFDESE
jgi:phosphocarrier protein